MNTKLDPIVSEFETGEAATSYGNWFRAKIQASLDDTRQGIPHDEVMANSRTAIEAAAQRQTLA